MPYITANWVLIYYLYTNLYKGPWITFVNIDSTCPTHKTPRRGHGFGAQLMTAPQLVRLGDPREMLREKNAGQCIKPNQTHSLTPWGMPKRLGTKWVDNLCMFLMKRNCYFVVSASWNPLVFQCSGRSLFFLEAGGKEKDPRVSI